MRRACAGPPARSGTRGTVPVGWPACRRRRPGHRIARPAQSSARHPGRAVPARRARQSGPESTAASITPPRGALVVVMPARYVHDMAGRRVHDMKPARRPSPAGTLAQAVGRGANDLHRHRGCPAAAGPGADVGGSAATGHRRGIADTLVHCSLTRAARPERKGRPSLCRDCAVRGVIRGFPNPPRHRDDGRPQTARRRSRRARGPAGTRTSRQGRRARPHPRCCRW
jgi:hypothetical protein